MKYLMNISYGRDEDIKLTFYDEITSELKIKKMKIAKNQPYFITNTPVKESQSVTRVEPANKRIFVGKEQEYYKHYAKSPKIIPKLSALYSDVWENRIAYLERLKYDLNLVMGMPYTDEGEYFPDKDIKGELFSILKEYPDEILERYVPIFQTRIPYLDVLALDLEIDSDKDRFPSVEEANKRIISAALTESNGKSVVYVLARDDVADKEKGIPHLKAEVVYFDSEVKLISAIFDYIDETEAKILVTFNGDNFDIPYLVNRSRWFKIPRSAIPVFAFKGNDGRYKTRIEGKFHLDLYLFMKNPAVKNYVFNAKYKFDGLTDITEVLLKEKKYDVGVINEVSLEKLAYYNWKDTDLLIKLLEMDNKVIMYIIFLFMRIGCMSFEDASRRYISRPLSGLFMSYLISNDYLIPRKRELLMVGSASTKAVIKGKKYSGALVKIKRGFYENVTMPDFASLYPSIIKEYNLSPETINCGHPECIDNIIKGTDHHVCRLKKGIVSTILGFFKDVRVGYYKKLDGEFADNIQRGLKVLINASYGVLAADIFPLFCIPVADCTTAKGRESFKKLEDKCIEKNIPYIGGDTDSCFLQTVDNKLLDELCLEMSEEMNLDLAYSDDEKFIWMGCYEKKNYIAKPINGEKFMIKGLVGKKKHVPAVIKKPFDEIIDELYKVNVTTDLPTFMEKATIILNDAYHVISTSNDYPSFAFKVTLGMDIDKYKVRNEYVKVGENIPNAREGTIIRYVKGINRPYHIDEQVIKLDREKYLKLFNNTLSQLMLIFDYDVDKTLKSYRLQKNFLRFF